MQHEAPLDIILTILSSDERGLPRRDGSGRTLGPLASNITSIAETPLHWAAKKSRDLVLLRALASAFPLALLMKNSRGQTPLTLARAPSPSRANGPAPSDAVVSLLTDLSAAETHLQSLVPGLALRCVSAPGAYAFRVGNPDQSDASLVTLLDGYNKLVSTNGGTIVNSYSCTRYKNARSALSEIATVREAAVNQWAVKACVSAMRRGGRTDALRGAVAARERMAAPDFVYSVLCRLKEGGGRLPGLSERILAFAGNGYAEEEEGIVDGDECEGPDGEEDENRTQWDADQYDA